jgi:hypothetical protein
LWIGGEFSVGSSWLRVLWFNRGSTCDHMVVVVQIREKARQPFVECDSRRSAGFCGWLTTGLWL